MYHVCMQLGTCTPMYLCADPLDIPLYPHRHVPSTGTNNPHSDCCHTWNDSQVWALNKALHLRALYHLTLIQFSAIGTVIPI